MKNFNTIGFSPDILGLINENISLSFLKKINRGTHTHKGPHNGIDITSSDISKPFNAGIHGLIISTDEATGIITLLPFGRESTIQYLNCSSFLKGTGVVAPWTKIGMTGKTRTNTESSQIFLHIQIFEEGKPPYRQWEHNFVDPVKYRIDNLIIGTWKNHLEVLKEDDLFSITKESNFKITSTIIGSHFQYEYHLEGDSANGRINIFAEWECTLINYTDIGVNCYCKFIKCNGNIPCMGQDFNMEINLINLDTLAGSTISGKPAVFERSTEFNNSKLNRIDENKNTKLSINISNSLKINKLSI